MNTNYIGSFSSPRSVFFVAAALAVMVGGCNGPTTSASTEQAAKPVNFTSEDKRVARLLSIGNRPDLLTGNAYQKAQHCSLAIETLLSELRESSAMNQQQLNAMLMVKNHFDRQASELGRAEGKRAAQIAADRLDLIQDDSRRQERMVLSLSCLQNARDVIIQQRS